MLDDAQAATVDRIEAGQRVSGTVRLALEVSDSDSIARRLVAAGAEHVAPPVTTPWGSKRPGLRPRRHAADALHPTVRVRSSPPVLALRVKPAALTGECASCGGRSDRASSGSFRERRARRDVLGGLTREYEHVAWHPVFLAPTA